MPIYEYECKKCHHQFEKIQKFSDPHPKKCPKCGGQLELVISAPAVQFKGSGWYVTDYAKKSGSSSGGDSQKESSPKDDSSDKSKSEDKPKPEKKKAEKK